METPAGQMLQLDVRSLSFSVVSFLYGFIVIGDPLLIPFQVGVVLGPPGRILLLFVQYLFDMTLCVFRRLVGPDGGFPTSPRLILLLNNDLRIFLRSLL